MVKRVLLGKFPDGGYGLRVSEPGYDVTSNPVDNARLHFSSDWPAILPIYVYGTVSLTAGVQSVISYANLGYYPFSAALVQRPGRAWEHFAHSNSVARGNDGVSTYSTPNGASSYTFYNDTFGEYIHSGNTQTNLIITAYPQSLILQSDTALSVTYFVYRQRAF